LEEGGEVLLLHTMSLLHVGIRDPNTLLLLLCTTRHPLTREDLLRSCLSRMGTSGVVAIANRDQVF
jgi:hypothetical protein